MYVYLLIVHLSIHLFMLFSSIHRTVLSELKHSTQSLAYHQKCPATVSRLVLKLVDIISRLSPTPPPN